MIPIRLTDSWEIYEYRTVATLDEICALNEKADTATDGTFYWELCMN